VKTENSIPNPCGEGKGGNSFCESLWISSEERGRITLLFKKERWNMNIVRHTFLLGLVGLLAGCVTPTDMGYVLPPEPAYTAPVSTAPVYNASPAYYPTPVSGYSTLTVYDGYYPAYSGPRYPHHHRPPPPRWHHRPGMHGGPASRHGGHHGSGGKNVPIRQYQLPGRRQPTIKPPPGRGVPGRGAPGRGVPGRGVPGRGVLGRGVPPGKGGGRKR